MEIHYSPLYILTKVVTFILTLDILMLPIDYLWQTCWVCIEGVFDLPVKLKGV